jgi:hypothetical protein
MLFRHASEGASYGEVAVLNGRQMHLSARDGLRPSHSGTCRLEIPRVSVL